MSSAVTLEYRGKIAIISIDNQKKLNVATKDQVFITVLTGKGRYFSARRCFLHRRLRLPLPGYRRLQEHWLKIFVAYNLNITQAFYTHSKILVSALNGPAIGISAALIAFSDFIYCVPSKFLLTPFSSLGLVAEGGASRVFVQRLGISKANEALIMSKRITAEELLQVGFVNKIFDVEERLGDHLIGDSMTKIKALIRKPEIEAMDTQGVGEVFAGWERFQAGIPQKEFAKIASGEKRHKL
ncbi:unnamed protein product [Diplocarpon coronariae]